MLKYYAIKNNAMNPIWIDIFDPTVVEEKLIEQYLKINLPTQHEMTPRFCLIFTLSAKIGFNYFVRRS